MNKRRMTLLGLGLLSLFISLPAHSKVFKIATLSPEGSTWMNKMRAGAKEIEGETKGRVKFKFYTGGVMGDDKAVLRKMRIRQLQGGAVTAGSVTHLFPGNTIYSQPLMFRTLEEVSYVRERMDKMLIEGLDKAGLVTFGLAEGGFAYIMSNDPIYSITDLQKQKAWVPSADKTVQAAASAFQITPIPLPLGDVLAGLQTKLINTVAAPPIVTLALQWHTQVKYLTDMPLLYSYAHLVIDKKAFKKISKKDQAIVRKTMSRIFKEIDTKNRKDNINALTALRNQGIKFLTPSKAQLKVWRDTADDAQKRVLATGVVNKKLWDTLQGHLQAYRAMHK